MSELKAQNTTTISSPPHTNPFCNKRNTIVRERARHRPLLPPTERQHLQSIVDILLYFARALEYSTLPALNDVSREQVKPTVSTMNCANRILDYAATYPSAYIRYHASDMTLHVDSDATYLVTPQSKSRIARFYHLASSPSKHYPPPLNRGLLVECKTLHHIVASAAEAEMTGVFYNAQITILARRILHALNHVQPPTPLKTDNSTANGFIHNNIRQKRSKSWDMRYYWLRDKMVQTQFNFFERKDIYNNINYFTKHHPTKHHRTIRPRYVRDKNPSPTGLNRVANHIFILYMKTKFHE